MMHLFSRTSFVGLLLCSLALLACKQIPVLPEPAQFVAPASSNSSLTLQNATIPLQGPISQSFPGTDAFETSAPSPEPVKVFPSALQYHLRVGEVMELVRGVSDSSDGHAELAFYVAPEGAAIAQLVVESHGGVRSYCVKALARGIVLGGVVERRWLDKSGLCVSGAWGEAHVQAAIKAHPYLIIVE